MAHPLTAVNADVKSHTIEKLLIDIQGKSQLCEIILLSRGGYGFVFRIGLHEETNEEMNEGIDSPFNTFTIGDDDKIEYTSEDMDHTGKLVKTFCCKLVPISEPPSEISIEIPGEEILSQTTSTPMSFNNECNKQRQIYAMTNDNLNPVCLPLFRFDIVNITIDNILKDFIQFIFSTTGITITIPEGVILHYGISFMPFSPNVHTTKPIRQIRTTLTMELLTSHTTIQYVTHSIGLYTIVSLTENRVIDILKKVDLHIQLFQLFHCLCVFILLVIVTVTFILEIL
jgi:hypothetical protein